MTWTVDPNRSARIEPCLSESLHIVIGGGPAGSSAAIRLAQTGRRVRLYEKATFPRAKLCGGFLSGESLGDLEELGVLQTLKENGAVTVKRVVITSCSGRLAEAPLARPGLSISRDVLDTVLLEKARELGVEVREGENGFGHEQEAEWMIQACGRKIRGSGYTGIQAFFENIPHVTDQVELHLVPGGYVGLVRQNGGRVNVCALTHRQTFAERGATLDVVIAAWKRLNPILSERMRQARRISPWQAVGPVSMGIRQLTAPKTLFTGDAACVVDPFAGEGLAMALASSRLIVQALETQDSSEIVYEKLWHASFDSSLRYQRWVRRSMNQRLAHEGLVYGLHIFPKALTWLNTLTRPSFYEHDHTEATRSVA